MPEKPAGTVVHTVQKGETLGHTARQYYGKSSQWNRILEANRDVAFGVEAAAWNEAEGSSVVRRVDWKGGRRPPS